MQLPGFVSKIINHKEAKQEYFLSLILDSDFVAGACWHLDRNSQPVVIHAVIRRLTKDDWNERTIASDEVIGKLEQFLGTEALEKTIYGLPVRYLGSDGVIKTEDKLQIKTLTKKLALNAIGYVPIDLALAYKIKIDEGIPASVIFIRQTSADYSISLYKVGKLIHQEHFSVEADPVKAIEHSLSKLTDVEVLPSRVLLYGSDSDKLDLLQSMLTKHQWTDKVNFLHLPKIEKLSLEFLVRSVSFAGAKELANETPPDDKEVSGPEATVPDSENEEIQTEYINDGKKDIEVRSEPQDENESPDEEEKLQLPPDDSRPESEDKPEKVEKTSNIQFVPPEKLGFSSKTDVLTEDAQISKTQNNFEKSEKTINKAGSGLTENLSKLPRMIAGKFGFAANILTVLFSKTKSNRIYFAVLPILFLTAAAIFLAVYLLPKATVKLYILPKQIVNDYTIEIDPALTSVDADNLKIPALKKQKTITGDEVINVSGKKKVGDPAKGSVTVYNKTLTKKALKKSSVLSTGNIEFTLDADVEVASASESIGSITFGKATVAVTAVEIGPLGNIGDNKEFIFKEYPESSLIARNDKAFAGGNSREVTVVTRADYDALSSKAEKRLIEKAKAELAGSVSGSEKLVDQTIVSKVTNKKFQEELNQESDKLHGTVTVEISGLSYSDADLKNLFANSIKKQITAEYTVEESDIGIDLKKIKVDKSGILSSSAHVSAKAMPVLDSEKIRSAIAGKNIDEAQKILKSLPGVSEAEFLFSYSLSKSKFPMRPANITLVTEVRN